MEPQDAGGLDHQQRAFVVESDAIAIVVRRVDHGHDAVTGHLQDATDWHVGQRVVAGVGEIHAAIGGHHEIVRTVHGCPVVDVGREIRHRTVGRGVLEARGHRRHRWQQVEAGQLEATEVDAAVLRHEEATVRRGRARVGTTLRLGEERGSAFVGPHAVQAAFGDRRAHNGAVGAPRRALAEEHVRNDLRCGAHVGRAERP